MRVGDKLPVTIEGHIVAYAELNKVGGEEVELTIPATHVIMGVAHQLTSGPAPTPEKEVEIVSARPGEGDPIEPALPAGPVETPVPAEPAPSPAPEVKPEPVPTPATPQQKPVEDNYQPISNDIDV